MGMSQADLPRFLALSDQLVAFVKAGVPVQLGLPPRPSAAAIACEHIGSLVARRVGEGASLGEALGDSAVPPRSTARWCNWLWQVAICPRRLAGARNIAQERDEGAGTLVRAAVALSLLICTLRMPGLIGFFVLHSCQSWRPYTTAMGIRAGWGLAISAVAGETLPYWVLIPPVVLGPCGALAAMDGDNEHRDFSFSWIPGMSKLAA